MHHSLDDAFAEVENQRGYDPADIRHSYHGPPPWYYEAGRSEKYSSEKNPEYDMLSKNFRSLICDLAAGLAAKTEAIL